MSILPDPANSTARPRPCDLPGCVDPHHPLDPHECQVDVHAAPIVSPAPDTEPYLTVTAVRDTFGDWVDLDLGVGPAVRISLGELLDAAAAAAGALAGVR